MDKLKKIFETGILPQISIKDSRLAIELSDAFCKGGLPLIEIDIRSECAAEAVSLIRKHNQQMTIGAGAVTTTEQARTALSAGADYVSSPGFDAELVKWCSENSILIIPGCATASEIQAAVGLGLSTVKIFPAEPGVSSAQLRLLSGAFPQVKFILSGGIDFQNLGDYLRIPCVAACCGSFMASADDIVSGNFDEITEKSHSALMISLGFELVHVGINHDNDEDALKTAETFSSIFGLQTRMAKSSVFSGKFIEAMKMNFLGTKGHIAFSTNSVERALAYFRASGTAINESTVKSDEKGIAVAYLADEIGGFAVHVVRRS